MRDVDTPLERATAVFIGDGETARLGRNIDWSHTALGPEESWPESLKTAVRMALESPFPINLWCGPDLLLIYNDAYRRVLGAKHPRSFGRSGREVWAEIWPEIASLFTRIDGGGSAAYAEDARFMMERASGPPDEAWFTFSLSPIRSSDGSIVAFLNIATETTERVLAQRSLDAARRAAERAEQQLREVFAQAPAFMAVLRGNPYVFEFANDAYRQLVGGRDVIGKRLDEALPEIVDQGFIDILDQVVRDNAPFIGREVPVMLARGSEQTLEPRYVDFVYQPIADADGRVTGIVVHGSDVTDAVVARHEIEQSEARYRFLANAIPVQVWTATPLGALDYVSDPTARYFGKTPAEVVGEQWLTVLHPNDVEPTLQRWQQSLTTGTPYETEFRLFHAETKEYRWHLSRATPERDLSGAIVRWVGTNTDIEDRKRAEADLERLTAEAMEANRAKSAFLASMSHELRTPLNAIGGYAQLLEMGIRGPVNDEQRADLLKIQRSKNHLDALVSDVLDFAKLNSGRVEYHIHVFALRPMVGSVVDMITPQANAKRQQIVVTAIAPEVTIKSDEDKLRQILLNLLGNAVKFTPEGGRITIATGTTPTQTIVSVSDTGIGVAPAMLEQIFEPFVQAKPTLTGQSAGVGLGLAISRQLAREMGGDLVATSEVGSGATFTLSLPAG